MTEPALRRRGARSLLGTASTLLALSAPARAETAPEPAAPDPPPMTVDYFVYGVALTVETALSGGDVCPAESETPCILGSGGGLAIRAGFRARGPWYIGGAYEFSRQDPANLLRLAILQQLRVELRYYWDRSARLTPYFQAGGGAVVYGNEFGADTGGAVGSVGPGFEFQISDTAVVGAALSYRPLLLKAWTDSAGQLRADRYFGFGLAHFFALELTLEIREPLPRW